MATSTDIYARASKRKKEISTPIVQDKFSIKIASNVEEIKELAKKGYEKFDELNGKHLYRKRETNLDKFNIKAKIPKSKFYSK